MIVFSGTLPGTSNTFEVTLKEENLAYIYKSAAIVSVFSTFVDPVYGRLSWQFNADTFKRRVVK